MNTLIIKNQEEFDEEVWQDKTYFTEEQYNEWLQYAKETLKEIYDDYEGKADVYVLGDIINMISNTTIKLKG